MRAARAIEAEVRERLRVEFEVTLPQFDVMAALERKPDGMTMTELSRFLMVSNGNVTGIIDRLVSDKLVARQAPADDRRAIIVRLTPRGLKEFTAMAKAHETLGRWLAVGIRRGGGGHADPPSRRIVQPHSQRRIARMTMSDFKPKHFNWSAQNGVAVITLKGAERKNPITFESYAELGQTFRELARARDIKVVVFGSNGGNFCSGGDVHDIIGPLLSRDMKGLLEFTRMTGELVKAMRACPQPIIAAIDGVCVGAGAMIALFCDIRLGTPQAKTAFLFTRVGPCRLRHGRLRSAAARHRPRPRVGAALYRPRHDSGGGRALGLFQSHCRRR